MITPTKYLQVAVSGPFKSGTDRERPPYGVTRDSSPASYQAIETEGDPGGQKSADGHRVCRCGRTRGPSDTSYIEHLCGTLSHNRG